METITWRDFEKVELTVGSITKVELFQEARKPAYKLWVDLGPAFGVKKSSAQITENYLPEDLIDKQVICVTNFAPKQIGPFISEILVTGLPNAKNEVVLATVDAKVPNGSRLF